MSDNTTQPVEQPKPTHKVRLVFMYNKGKHSCWLPVPKGGIITEDTAKNISATLFSAKASKRRTSGGIYEVESNEDGTSIFLNTMVWVDNWPIKADRLAWSMKQTAHQQERQTKHDDLIEEAIADLLYVYRKLPHSARAVMLHKVIGHFIRVL